MACTLDKGEQTRNVIGPLVQELIRISLHLEEDDAGRAVNLALYCTVTSMDDKILSASSVDMPSSSESRTTVMRE